jgi:hypothetical protein
LGGHAVHETPSSFDYLLKCSTTSLEGFELARLNRIANLRKELRDLVEEWVAAEVEARVSRWLLLARRTRKQAVLPFGEPAISSSEPPRLLDAIAAEETCSATPFPFSPGEAAAGLPPGWVASRHAEESRGAGSPAAETHGTEPPRAGPSGAKPAGAGSKDSPHVAATSHALSRYIFSAHAPPACLPVMRPRIAGDDSAAAARTRRRESA